MKRNGATLALLALLLAALSTWNRQAAAHGVDPIGVAIVEHAGGEVHVRLDRPSSLAGSELAVVIDDCAQSGERTRTLSASRAVDELQLRCGEALAGRTLRVEGLAESGLDTVLRAQLLDGTVHRSVVTASAPEVSLPAASSAAETLLAYLALGAKHLATGFDHLLFILGTLLLERRPRRTALALTGFTIGHSLTLCAAVLGFLRIPSAWAEVGIALSLVWLAIEIMRSDGTSSTSRMAGVSLVIGLVHGLGFSSVMVDAGIPMEDLPLALLGFNLGIELCQLGLVAVAFLLAAVALRLRLPQPREARSYLAHGIGALAVMWCIERVLAV